MPGNNSGHGHGSPNGGGTGNSGVTEDDQQQANGASQQDSSNDGAKGGKGGKGGGKGKDDKGGKDKINPIEIEKEYGLSYALFKAFPELMDLLQKAVNKNWTATRFQVELRQTEWFKKHSDVWRQNIALKYADPAAYHERLQNALTTVGDVAGQFGIDLSGKALHRLAERSLLFGWDTNVGQIRDHLAHYVEPTPQGHFEGELAGIEDTLRRTAGLNGVRIGDHQIQGWMRSIVRGNASQEQFQRHIRDVAAQTFSAYGDQIKSGIDLQDIANPYIQSMSDILELNPNGIDMFDRTLRKAMSNRDEKGNAIPMSLTDFEDSLRDDKRWQYTKNAKDQMTQYAVSLGQMFGVL